MVDVEDVVLEANQEVPGVVKEGGGAEWVFQHHLGNQHLVLIPDLDATIRTGGKTSKTTYRH